MNVRQARIAGIPLATDLAPLVEIAPQLVLVFGSVKPLTTKDGLLAVDEAKLAQVLASDAGAVEALFNPRRDGGRTAASDPGIAFTLDAIRDKAIATDGVIDRVTKSLDSRKATLLEQLENVETREDAYRARLEKQYSSLDARLAAFKATQTYLEQQIKLWTNQGND